MTKLRTAKAIANLWVTWSRAFLAVLASCLTLPGAAVIALLIVAVSAYDRTVEVWDGIASWVRRNAKTPLRILLAIGVVIIIPAIAAIAVGVLAVAFCAYVGFAVFDMGE